MAWEVFERPPRSTKYAPIRERVLALAAGDAIDVRCDTEGEAMRIFHAIRRWAYLHKIRRGITVRGCEVSIYGTMLKGGR